MKNSCLSCTHYQDDTRPDDGFKSGSCKASFWSIYENYYVDTPNKPLIAEGVSVTYLPRVGEDFSCIHYFSNIDASIAKNIGIPSIILKRTDR
jgi:hypothetical protein